MEAYGFKTMKQVREEAERIYAKQQEIHAPIQETEDLPYGKDAMCICADCSEIVPMWVECESTRQPDHDGIWADCPECGITGVE